ncbi:MAG TPA: amidohydrolase family protein [Vicinamibacterales bacterium]|nr:amidohydrolase family protein [Vicinamibacterales bacterium]
MISRREAIRRAAAAAAAVAHGTGLAASASQPATKVAFAVPPGACDCHTHVFGDPRAFPFAAGRTYTPEPASVLEMRSLHRALRMDRVVIVQPSVYGSDNTCTVDAIRQLGPRARGIAVVDDLTTDGMLDALHRGGIRGIRLNLETFGLTDPDAARARLRAAIARVKERGWHVQLYTRLSVVDALAPEIRASAVPIVVDHFGGAQASLGPAQPGFQTLVELVRSGRVHVKISGAYRTTALLRGPLPPGDGPDYADVAPLAQALVSANAERIVWGTDWPHPDSSRVPGRTAADIAPLLQIDDGRLLNQFASWVPDAATRRQILVENPRRLYGF